ncbi:MAG: iron ABC transporter permease [Ruminococcaceae bacterium]|nr:iron ABC transporter permease [Oscillospiraceae bacterium]
MAKVRVSAKRQNNENIKLRPSESSQLGDLRKEQERHQKVRSGNLAILIAFLILLVLYLFSLTMFVVPAQSSGTLAGLLMLMREKFDSFLLWVQGSGGGFNANFVRYTIILLSGAALASAGCVFQGSFRNIIASPSTMGVQAGASLGNALYTFFFVDVITETIIIKNDQGFTDSLSLWDLNKQPLCAILGALVSVGVVTWVASLLGKGTFSGGNILFSGIVFSSFVGAINTVIEYYFMYMDPDDSRWQALRVFSMGNFDKVMSFQHLGLMSAVLVPCLLILILMSPKLNVIVMGEDEAATMGVNVRLYRTLLIVIGTLMAAVVYAFCGAIGFVGFICPQICRRFTGPDFRKLLPMCMFVGGILLILVYNIALIMGFSMYMNMVTSVIGCAMMIYALFTGRGGRQYG